MSFLNSNNLNIFYSCYNNKAMQNIEEIFQFNLIQETLSTFARTSRGKNMALNLKPYEFKDELIYELESLKEMLFTIQRNGLFPISFSEDAIPLIALGKKGGILSIRDLDMIAEDVLTSFAVIKYINKIDDSCINLKEKGKEFNDLSSLEKEIHRCITKSQTIDDKASPTLFEIRKKIAKLEKELNSTVINIASRYKEFLSDESVTLRDGHYVIPVKTSYKSKVRGIIHDVSDSGFTTFIEPSDIVELNNDLVSLHFEEQDEIRKILKSLTNLCVLQEIEILKNNDLIAYFDFLMAKSLYAGEIDANIATLSEDNELYLRSARHPLIPRDKVVANSFSFNKEKRLVIISGPNAGGKTVALKTVGLLCYMHKCALAVSALEAKIPFFNNIFVDIGDNQSISDNLSTFSAHISHIGEITRRVKSKDLVLIDELGTGTDPSEGEALAIAVIKKLVSVNCIALISSHFSRLKEYAFTSKNIDNASMLFDEDNLTPTYIYKQGVPGQSYALEVADKYGLAKDIINEAKEYLTKIKESDVNELMNELHKAALNNELRAKQIQEEKAKLEKERKIFEADKNLLKEKREKLLESVENEKEEIINSAKEEVDEILKKLNNPNLKAHEVIKLKKELDDLSKAPENIHYNEKVEVGCYASIPSLNINGKVMKINGNKAYINSDSGMSFQVEIAKLHIIDEPAIKKTFKRNVDQAITSNVGLECNVIGLHVDEAMIKVEKYLDQCQLKGHKQVRLIHGFGSGALKNAIREYLKKCSFIESYRSGNEYEGGGGATVVYLK